jgi:hypothetical protein
VIADHPLLELDVAIQVAMCRKATSLPEFSKTPQNIGKLKSYIQYLGSHEVSKAAPQIKAASFFPELAHHLPSVTEAVKADMRAVRNSYGHVHSPIADSLPLIEGSLACRTSQSHVQLVQQPRASEYVSFRLLWSRRHCEGYGFGVWVWRFRRRRRR